MNPSKLTAIRRQKPTDLNFWMRCDICAILAAACISMPCAACDLCAVYSAQPTRTAEHNGIFAGIAEQFTRFNTLQADGQTVPNGGEYINSVISQLFAGYSFNDKLSVQVNLPILSRFYGSDAGGDHSVSGLGDVSALGSLRLFEHRSEPFSFSWHAVSGVKFPTGSTSHLNPEEADFATGIGGHDLTLGSGSYDAIAGTGFSGHWKRFFVTGNAQYAIRSTGAYDYRFANDWIWWGGPGMLLPIREKHSLRVQAIVSGETKGMDTAQGSAVDDTAITVTYLGPQLIYSWSSRLSAQLGADLPVSIHTSGNQLAPDFRVRGSFAWQF